MSNLDPHIRKSVSLCEALDRAIDTGVVVLGEVTLSVADVDLIYLGLQLVLTSVENGGESDGIASTPSSRVLRGGPQNDPPPTGTEHGQDGWRQITPPAGPQANPGGLPPIRKEAKDAGPPASRQSGRPAVQAGDKPPRSATGGQDPNKNGLGQLVLALIKVLHELLQRQALRRMEAGSLSIAEIENLGATLMRQAREIERLAGDLGLEMEDLNLDLGPLGKLL